MPDVPVFSDICNGNIQGFCKSEPKKAEIGADRGFETGVSAKNGQKQRRDSFLRQPVGRMCGSVAEGGRVLWDGVVEEEPANEEEG